MTKANTTRPGARPIELSDHERWYAKGSDVVELEYLGQGRYWATRTTVERVTPAQIVTGTGRRFWRYRNGLGLVGQADKRAAGIAVNPVRITPPDNPRAVEFFAKQGTR